MAYLALVRHGQSRWNAQGRWTGLTDIGLNNVGKDEAARASHSLKDTAFDTGFTSPLKRAKQTLEIIKKELGIESLPTEESTALNERDYGDYTGKNKWEIKDEVGEEKFDKIRRGWNEPIPNGETLEDVYKRIVPYYKQSILPKLKSGQNIIVSAHGNSLRALVKYLEQIPDDKIANLEIGTGQIYLYQLDKNGKIISKL